MTRSTVNERTLDEELAAGTGKELASFDGDGIDC